MPSKTLLTNFLDKVGITINGPKPYDMRIHNPKFYSSMILNPSLGAGEGYMKGWWDCDQLDEFFFKICQNHLGQYFYSKWHIAFYALLNSITNLQSPSKSKQVAEQHYNLGNELYRYMLGPSMAYTCGYWRNAKNLDQAQYDKFDLICRKVQLKPGEKVLELGCGWGSLAKYMAEKYGCEVVAVNISTEQVNYAQKSCAGLPVRVHLCDYRDDHVYNPEKKPFDKVVSVGLCEHIGHKNYQHFLRIALQNMKEDGLFLLHTIGKNVSTPYVDPWINKYIFPNGILPSIKLLGAALEDLFVLEDLHNFGADYDKTLMAWQKNFVTHWPEIEPHIVSNDKQTFYRLWNYYLLSCAGAFRARSLQLWQLVLSPKGVLNGYQSIR